MMLNKMSVTQGEARTFDTFRICRFSVLAKR